MASSTKKIIIIALILLCITCVFFWRVIFLGETTVAADILQQWYPWKFYITNPQPVRNNYFSDNIVYFYPAMFYANEMIKEGQIPLWNPYTLCGKPFLANHYSAIFSPFSLIFYLFPLKQAFGYANIAQIFLAGLLMFLFMHTIKVSSFGSFVASLVFMFNGFFMVWLEDPTCISTALWLPLILLFLEKMVRGPKRILFAILAGGAIAFQFLSGHIQVSLYILLGIVIYTIIRIPQLYSGKEKIKEMLHCLFFLGIAFLLGFVLAAIQLIPFAELVPLSHRIGNLYKYKFQLINLSCFLHLITFIVPNIFGNPNNYWGAENYVELCGYIGILPLILAVFALSSRKNKLIVPFLVIAIFSLLVYLQTPFLALLYLIPGYNRSIGFTRIIFLYTFAASVLAGFGADYLDKEKGLKSRIKALNKFIIKCLFIGIFLFLLGNSALQIGKDHIINQGKNIFNIRFSGEPNFGIMLQNFFKNFSSSYEDYLRYYHLLSPVIYIPFLLTVASICIFILYFKKGATILFKVILCLVIIVDLFYFGLRYLPIVKPELIYPEVEAVKFLKNDSSIYRAISLEDTTFPSNTMFPYKIQNVNGIGSLYLKRYIEFISLIDKDAVLQSICPYYIHLTDSKSILTDLINVKYILTTREINEDKLRLIYNKEIRIYENMEVFPRAFVVPKAVVIKEKEEILRHLSSKYFEPTKYVILEEEPDIDHRPKTIDHRLEKEQVTITKYEPNEVAINVVLSSSKFLILSDSYYPGWKVYVDGKEDKLFCANYIMRAVYLDKGDHKVDFIYDPVSFKVGKYISFLSLILITSFLGIHLVARLKPRKI
jgi:hypothetical protein